MNYQEYDRKINQLFDKMITAPRDQRPAIEREIRKLEKLAEKGLTEE